MFTSVAFSAVCGYAQGKRTLSELPGLPVLTAIGQQAREPEYLNLLKMRTIFGLGW